MRHQRVRRPLRLHFCGGFAERQRLALREQIGHQQIVLVAERVQRAGRSR